MSYFEPSPGLDVVIKPAFIEEISVISVVFGRKCAVEVIAKIIGEINCKKTAGNIELNCTHTHIYIYIYIYTHRHAHTYIYNIYIYIYI